MFKMLIIAVTILTLAAFTGCGTQGSASTGDAEQTADTERSIFVLCGAGIKAPMDEIGKVFQNKTNIKVQYTYSGSACLLAQIDNSRQGDAYMPGEWFYMEQADEKGYLTEVERIAYVIPVIGVAKGNPKKVRGLRDLARKDLRVGIGDPHATALGKQAYIVLKNAGLQEEVISNLTTSAATVPELGNAIKLGHLDAAIVWDAVAHWYPEDIDIVLIEPEYNEVSTVPLGTLEFAEDPQAAKKFLDFVASDEGKAIFKKHGYSLTPNLEL